MTAHPPPDAGEAARELARAFSALDLEALGTDPSPEAVHGRFGALIRAVLAPVEDLAAADLPAEQVNGLLGQLGRAGLGQVKGQLAAACRRQGISEIRLQTWIGPQGVGKGALGDTLRWSRRLFDGPDSAAALLETLASTYELTPEAVAGLQALVDEVPPALDGTIRRVLELMADEGADGIRTGTGGIFNPLGGVGEPDPRYAPYARQCGVTGAIVRSGVLVDGLWTSFLVALELVRSALLAARGTTPTVSLDVWPRTREQADCLREDLVPAMRAEGLELDHWLLHLEPVDEETVATIVGDREASQALFVRFGALLQDVAGDPASLGFSEDDLDVLRALGLDDAPDAVVAESLDRIKTEGSARMRLVGVELGARLRQAIPVSEGDEAARSVVDGLADAIKTGLARVANRVESQARPDDLRIGTVLYRLGAYYRETGSVALALGSDPIPVGGRHEAGRIGPQYESAIGGALRKLARLVDGAYDVSNPTFESLLRLATQLYLVRCSK